MIKVKNFSEIIEKVKIIDVNITVNELDNSLLSNKVFRVGTNHKPKGKNGWIKSFKNSTNIVIIIGNYENDSTLRFILNYGSSFERYTNRPLAQNFENSNQVNFKQLYSSLKVLNINNHPYFVNKNLDYIYHHDDIRLTRFGQLAIPIYNGISSDICGIQYINVDGTKRFHPQSILKRSVYFVNHESSIQDDSVAIIGEGYATVITAFQALILHNPNINVIAIVAFSANNLINVIDLISTNNILLLVDNDCQSKINVGLNTSQRILSKYKTFKNISLVIPNLPTNESCDINDYYRYYHRISDNGFSKVYQLIMNVMSGQQ